MTERMSEADYELLIERGKEVYELRAKIRELEAALARVGALEPRTVCYDNARGESYEFIGVDYTELQAALKGPQ